MRNFDISPDTTRRSEFQVNYGVSEVKQVETVRTPGEGGGGGGGGGVEDVERLNLQNLGDLSLEATDYIQQLELELSTLKQSQELYTREQENLQMEHIKKSNNDLLEYLRSLESEMVIELSRPSSYEVGEIIHQLAQNILLTFFKDEIMSDDEGDSSLRSSENDQNIDDNFCDTIGTTRDYLAKLLFWCMLLGHHLRGLENRLHLSCAVGLL
ncbi:hypothetical protein Adt_05516 [Abeliophyllum distichum]|uniref:Uncharacterized protein n=1 Tax=Abeliophyllum distichum TaxID=126358 RepID=A0ABD1V4B5_9LAMI